MGCIFSLIDFVFEEIIWNYFEAMQWIIPKRYFGKILRFLLQCVVGIFSFVLCVIMFVSVFGLIFGDLETKQFAVYTFFAPAVFSAVQILLGYFLRKKTDKWY